MPNVAELIWSSVPFIRDSTVEGDLVALRIDHHRVAIAESPCSSRIASGCTIRFWMARFSGRAP